MGNPLGGVLRTLFLKPGTGEGGAVLDVYIPALGRNIKPEGELVDVTTYVDRRMAEGSLVAVEQKKSVKGESDEL